VSRRILVPFSGTPASTAAIPAMARQHDADVVALVLDLGQGRELEDLRDRALGAGAIRVHVLDVREEFARDYVVPSLHAHAAGAAADPLGAELASGLIATKLAEIAQIEDATAVMDDAGGSSTAAWPTLWGRTGSYVWTRPASDAPDTAAEVDIAFEQGVPAAINGVTMIPTELIEILNIIAGHHGVGRIQMREMYGEAPAAVVLQSAYRALQNAVSAEGQPALVQGSVRVVLLKGEHTVVECRPNHAASQP
jgi:argininosuccinate synthase